MIETIVLINSFLRLFVHSQHYPFLTDGMFSVRLLSDLLPGGQRLWFAVFTSSGRDRKQEPALVHVLEGNRSSHAQTG